MSKKILIYGNGAMARVLYSYAKSSMNVCGFTVDDSCIKKGESSFCGLSLVPFSNAQKIYSPKDYEFIIAVGFIDMNNLREKKYHEAKEKGYKFTKYIHESVMIHDDVIIEENSIVLDHVSIHPGSKISRSTFISSNVNLGHDCIVEENNWINSGVSIAGDCRIGANSFFGVNSAVGHGVEIGESNFIAANTLINKSTQDNEVYLSEPGQRFRLTSRSFLKFSQALS